MGGFIVGLIIFSFGVKTRKWRIAMLSMGLITSMIFFGTGIMFMIKERKDDVAEEMQDVCAYYANFFEDYECNCRLGEEE